MLYGFSCNVKKHTLVFFQIAFETILLPILVYSGLRGGGTTPEQHYKSTVFYSVYRCFCGAV
jgi:hypothetical protein